MEQSKVGAFGPVVNLGSRLEGIAKQLGVPIILDEATAEIVRTDLSPAEGRCRRVVRLRPQGMRTPVFASELLPPEGLQSPLTDQDLADYGRALEAFISGDWEQASGLLAGLPAEDGAARFLLAFMAEHHGRPPQDWDGTINLKSK